MEKATPKASAPTMNDYYKVCFNICPASETACDLLADELAASGFESFVADDETPGATMTAYVPAPIFDEVAVQSAINNIPMELVIDYSSEFVEGQDWNSEWEKNYFQPILIGGKVAVHSSFHTDIPEAEYDITVDPRMAFGTGHHATTTLMMQWLLNQDLTNAIVTDMGTGTGILAILAAMRGAKKVTAIEIDHFAAENAVDNVKLNLKDGNEYVTVIEGDASALESTPAADFFVANINRNIITSDIAKYSKAIKVGGQLAVSGFYVQDRPIIEAAAKEAGFEPTGAEEMDNWSSMFFVKL